MSPPRARWRARRGAFKLGDVAAGSAVGAAAVRAGSWGSGPHGRAGPVPGRAQAGLGSGGLVGAGRGGREWGGPGYRDCCQPSDELWCDSLVETAESTVPMPSSWSLGRLTEAQSRSVTARKAVPPGPSPQRAGRPPPSRLPPIPPHPRTASRVCGWGGGGLLHTRHQGSTQIPPPPQHDRPPPQKGVIRRYQQPPPRRAAPAQASALSATPSQPTFRVFAGSPPAKRDGR